MSEVATVGPGEYTPGKHAIDGVRRGLQRAYVARLAGLAMSGGAGNADARSLAAGQLRALDGRIGALLAKGEVKLDEPSRAHLAETQARIRKVLEAGLELSRP